MAFSQRGKLCLFLTYLLFRLPHLDGGLELNNSESLSIDPVPANELNRLELVFKLEELVRNLSDMVTRLESKQLPEPPEVPPPNRESGFQDSRRKDKISNRSIREVAQQHEKVLDREERTKGVSFTKYSPFWSERFHFESAVKLDSDVTCMIVLPLRDYEGLSKYVAVGDDRGRVHVISIIGDVLVQLHTLTTSPVTALLSYTSVHKNESFIVTGHKNGAILMHRLWERSSEDYLDSLVMENAGRFVLPESNENDLSVTILEVHHAGRLRYVLSTDITGKITVFLEDGKLYGSAVPKSRPLAFLKQRLLFLTETGAGYLDLRSMKVKESDCEGLNHSLARSYVFDAAESSKAYGITSEDEIFHILLLGDIVNFKCRVRSKRKIDKDKPLALQAIKGYLLVVEPERVFVYNVSSQHYARVGAPRLLFSSCIDEIKSSFLNCPYRKYATDIRNVMPLIASDHEKLVLLGLGGGYVGIYRSKLPVSKEDDTILSTSTALFFIIFLFGAWRFFAKKKEALTSWGPHDPFTSSSAPPGSALRASSGERSSSMRNAEMMNLRSGLTDPSGRYVSPWHYPDTTRSSFRPNSPDHNSRPASNGADFRTATELKFRGSMMEFSNSANRRDSFSIGSQITDDRS